MRLAALAFWLLTVPAFAVRQDALTSALTDKQVEEAIQLGATGEPKPYLLRHAPGGITEDNAVILAEVYTPFLRVAFASHAAQRRGERLTIEDLPRGLLEPVVYIAFRWYAATATEASRLSRFKLRWLQPMGRCRSRGAAGLRRYG